MFQAMFILIAEHTKHFKPAVDRTLDVSTSELGEKNSVMIKLLNNNLKNQT